MDRPTTWREKLSVLAFSAQIAAVILLVGMFASGVLLQLGCGPSLVGQPPVVIPPTPRQVAATVSPHGTSGRLTLDDGRVVTATADKNGRLVFTLPPAASGGADLLLEAPGYRSVSRHVALNPELLPEPIALSRLLQRLHVEGRQFVAEDGSEFVWRGATAFRLVHMLALGQDTEVDAYLDWCAANGVSIVRVLSTAWNLFRLDATAGRRLLPVLLDKAEARGLYVEVVALVDTKAQMYAWQPHVQEIGSICAVHPACLVEMGNELDPIHPTQDDRLGDPAIVAELRKLIPDNVLVSLGSSHGPTADGSTKFMGGDYGTVHEDRADGDNGWRWVRHRNDTRELAERVGKPIVGDEPRRDDLAPDKHFAFAVLARINGLGDTFHYAGGMQGQVPMGAELEAFNARRRGWDVIPVGFRGHYQNVGLAGSPVPAADWSTVLKVFSSVNDAEGYTLALGGAAPRFDWAGDWPTRDLVDGFGGAWLWRIHR
jgi:hypothetical protein